MCNVSIVLSVDCGDALTIACDLPADHGGAHMARTDALLHDTAASADDGTTTKVVMSWPEN